MTHKPSPDKSSGFTLLEVLVVIVIIAALAAVSLTVSARMKQGASEATDMANLRQLGVAMLSTVADQGHFPYRFPTADHPRWDRFLFPALGFTDEIPGGPAETIAESRVPALAAIATIFTSADDKLMRPKDTYKLSYGVFAWTGNANGSPFGRANGEGSEMPARMSQIGRPEKAAMIAQKYSAENFLGKINNYAVPGDRETYGPLQLVLFADGHIQQLPTGMESLAFRKLYEPVTNGDNK